MGFSPKTTKTKQDNPLLHAHTKREKSQINQPKAIKKLNKPKPPTKTKQRGEGQGKRSYLNKFKYNFRQLKDDVHFEDKVRLINLIYESLQNKYNACGMLLEIVKFSFTAVSIVQSVSTFPSTED